MDSFSVVLNHEEAGATAFPASADSISPVLPAAEGENQEDDAVKTARRTFITLSREHARTIFNIDKHLVDLIKTVPFFAMISQWVRKTATYSIPTAGVTYNTKTDEITMFYNPLWMSKLTDDEVRGVLVHEFYHLVFNHVTDRRRQPHQIWNIATDLAINSIIVKSNGGKLPEGCLMPGVAPKVPDDREMTKEEKAASGAISALIESFTHEQASEFYFERLLEEAEKNGMIQHVYINGGAPGSQEGESGGSMDDHDMWDDIPEEARSRVEGKVKDLVERAVKHADNQSDGWGNIPASLREDIRKSVSNIVNWKALLRQFIGFSYRGERSKSIKRINKRYPYIHPGFKRGYVAKLLVAIDQSGSVDDRSLEIVAGELNSLTKHATIDVCTFDTEIDIADMYEWRKGQRFNSIKRTRCGGTDFNAPTHLVNDPKNQGRWDGLLVLSDGECSAPDPCKIKRAYVIVPGRKLMFPTTDTVITMDEGGSVKQAGAWR